MRYKLFKITAVLLMSVSMISCKKYLDINTNPNNAPSVDPKLLFSFAATSFINNRAGGDLFIPMALGGQSMASGGSSTLGISWGTGSEDQYVFSPFSYGNVWTQYYTSVGINLKKAIALSESGPIRNNNAAAQCKVVLAQMFYELTTIYGDIPFTEALREDISTPKFDAQQDVMNGSIALLDEAIAQFDENSNLKISGSYDQFYAGDISKWIKVARSIKLKILMTMVDKDPGKAEAIRALVSGPAADFVESPDDNFDVPFENTAGKRNPKFQISADYNAGIDFFYASPYVLDFMQAHNDPRIPKFFKLAQNATTYKAIRPGANANDTVHSKISPSLHTATEPEYVFTYQELLFFKAEVYARGLGGAQDLGLANTYYKMAVLESALFFGVAASDAEAFVASLPDLTAVADPIAEINYQHWIDDFDRGVDAFTQWRRSGPEGSEVPDLKIPTGAPAGGLFRRYEYPENGELSSNPNAPGLINFTEKVWFDL